MSAGDGDDVTVDHGSPLSWRDVYKAVNESEARIVQAVRDATAPIATAQADHENRLRKLETEGSSLSQAISRSTAALWVKHDALKVVVEANTAARNGFMQGVGLGPRAAVFLITLLGGLAVFLDIVSKYAHGP